MLKEDCSKHLEACRCPTDEDFTNFNEHVEHPITAPTRPKIPWDCLITTMILFYINLLNYMDRSTLSSITPELEKNFKIGDRKVALLTTVFVCAYMVFAPVFGYLGDRYSRKYIMAFGITIWSVNTFAGSLLNQHQYWILLVVRGFVGIGEASFSIVAPTVIADLFVGDQRTKALTFFNFAMPCGSGLGYIFGSQLAAAMKSWKWALRYTPGLGMIAMVLTLTLVHEPSRGEVEVHPGPPRPSQQQQTQQHQQLQEPKEELQQTDNWTNQNTSYVTDIKQILKIRSFVWSTLGFTCVSFATGALAAWAPAFVLYAEQVHEGKEDKTMSSVTFQFGLIVMIAGVVGNVLGAEWARRWRAKNMKSDAFVCGIGIIVATPCLFLALFTADKCFVFSWIVMFVGCVWMFFSWTPTTDMLLYVVPPNCRATAEAIQILTSHVFGDAFSPLIVGAISDAFIGDRRKSVNVKEKHLGLLYSFYATLAVLCAGAVCYFLTAGYLITDRRHVQRSIDAKTMWSLEDFPSTRRRKDSQANLVSGGEPLAAASVACQDMGICNPLSN